MDGTQQATLDAGATTPTAALAAFAASTDAARFDAETRRHAARHIIDTIGAIAAGRTQPTVTGAAGLLAELGGTGVVPVIGLGRTADPLSAAYLMAVSAHAIELDDGNREGSFHPGTGIVPAAAAAAWHLDASGADMLAAVVAGYEVSVRVARALHPHTTKRGFQNTPVVGVLGAATAVGRLLRLDAARMEQAIGAAASSSSGIFAYLTGGGTVKKFHPGHAAREGLLAAMMVGRGVIEGPRGVMETKAGLLQAFGGIAGWPAGLPVTGGAPMITQCYLKPYPCCRHIHPAIDALLGLMQEHGINPDGVAQLDVGTYEVAMPHVTLPWDDFVLAQLSFPYVMAAALRTGRIELDSFADAARANPAILADTSKVRVTVDPEVQANYPKNGPARVTLTLRDGRTLSRYVAEPSGAAANPMNDAAVEAKMRMTMQGWLDTSAQDKALAALWALDRLPRWRSVHNLLAKSTD